MGRESHVEIYVERYVIPLDSHANSSCFPCLSRAHYRSVSVIDTYYVSWVSWQFCIFSARTGFLMYPNGIKAAVTSIELNLWDVGETEHKPPAHWSCKFVAGEHVFCIWSGRSHMLALCLLYITSPVHTYQYSIAGVKIITRHMWVKFKFDWSYKIAVQTPIK
jgi:hypothetical protein